MEATSAVKPLIEASQTSIQLQGDVTMEDVTKGNKGQPSRYRHISPRKYTVDMDGKRDAVTIFNEFYKMYVHKLRLRAKRLCHRYHVAPFVQQDCVQAAMLAVFKGIEKWDPSKGSLYTYTYLGQTKAMRVVVREYHANRPYSQKPLIRYIASESDADWRREYHESKIIESASNCEERILTKMHLQEVMTCALRKDYKRVTRFMSYALDTKCVSILARESAIPVSKQAYYNSVVFVRKQLAKKVCVS